MIALEIQEMQFLAGQVFKKYFNNVCLYQNFSLPKFAKNLVVNESFIISIKMSNKSQVSIFLNKDILAIA